MALLPRDIPAAGDPCTEQVLHERWQLTRSMLLRGNVILPLTLVLICGSFAVLAGPGMVWWAMIPVATSSACAVALVVWLRNDGLVQPQSWLPATALITGTQLVLGVAPGFGVASHEISEIWQLFASALLVLGLLCTGFAWLTAHRAHRTLLAPLVAELGSTALHLEVREAKTHVELDEDRVTWSQGVIAFAQLRDVTARPREVLLRTDFGEWAIASDDPALLHELLVRRMIRSTPDGIADAAAGYSSV